MELQRKIQEEILAAAEKLENGEISLIEANRTASFLDQLNSKFMMDMKQIVRKTNLN